MEIERHLSPASSHDVARAITSIEAAFPCSIQRAYAETDWPIASTYRLPTLCARLCARAAQSMASCQRPCQRQTALRQPMIELSTAEWPDRMASSASSKHS